jgi:hypothetical protein
MKEKLTGSAAEVYKIYRDGTKFAYKIVRLWDLQKGACVQTKGTNPQAFAAHVCGLVQHQLLESDHLCPLLLLQVPFKGKSGPVHLSIDFREGG